MALQTKTFITGNSAWTEDYRSFTITLNLSENSTSNENNTSNISYELILKSEAAHNARFWYTGTKYIGFCLGSVDLSDYITGFCTGKDLSGNNTEIWSQTLFSGTVDVPHNTDGTLNMSVVVNFPSITDAGWGPNAMSISDTWTLTPISRSYTLTINYYSNNATECTNPKGVVDPLIGEGMNSLIATEQRPYDQAEDNLWDYSTLGLSRMGYYNTDYWNTSADGTGISISQDASYTGGEAWAKAFGTSILNGDQTVNIYAQWEPIKYNVKYDTNGATSGSVNDQELTFGEFESISSGGDLKKEYTIEYYVNDGTSSKTSEVVSATLLGWKDHNSITYGEDDYPWYAIDAPFYANTYPEIIDYYGYDKYNIVKHWIQNYVNEIDPLRYDPSSPVFSLNYYYNSIKSEIESVYGGEQPKKVYVEHWINYGYDESRRGIESIVENNSDIYPVGASVKNLTTKDELLTLTAKWQNNSTTLSALTRAGYHFIGWNTEADGSGTTYPAGYTVTPDTNMKLYAQWTQGDVLINFNGNGVTELFFNDQPVNHVVLNGVTLF